MRLILFLFQKKKKISLKNPLHISLKTVDNISDYHKDVEILPLLYHLYALLGYTADHICQLYVISWLVFDGSSFRLSAMPTTFFRGDHPLKGPHCCIWPQGNEPE